MSESDLESQIDELLALESIYDETCFRTSRPADGLTPDELREDELLAGFFTAELNFSSPVVVKLKSVLRKNPEDPDCDTNSNSIDVTTIDVEVTSLPPIVLNFELPRTYPSASAPNFSLTSKWMPHVTLTRVAKQLDAIWEENSGSEIIFTWTSFLKDELVVFLSLSSPVDLTGNDLDEELDPRCVRDILDADLLLPAIKEHDEVAKEKIFKSTVFQCNVCFDDQFGSNSIQFLPCRHVFCNGCMTDYFTFQIKDGSVRCLTCPEDKCTSVALPFQVKALVPPDLYSAYDRLLLQTTLDTMVDVVYCPRKFCSTPVMLEPDSTMAMCPGCKFVFCYFCKMTYHGVAPCRLESSRFKEIRGEYESADRQGRELMESRYGKGMLRRIFEEQQSEKYLEKNCQKCPGCKTNVDKIEGCNKMTCSKCGRFFCWICGMVLSKDTPYLHFNAPGGGCYGKLFEGVEDNDNDDDDVVDINLAVEQMELEGWGEDDWDLIAHIYNNPPG